MNPIPTQRSRWTALVPRLAAGIGVATLGVWALGPVARVAISSEVPTNPIAAHGAVPSEPAFDPDAFRIPLWVVSKPPEAPVPEPSPAPLPAFKVQLLAIISDGPELRALVYDPDLDKLAEVTGGAALGERTVESVTRRGVVFRDRHGLRSLTLAQDQPRQGGAP